MVPSSSFISFPAIAPDLQQSALFRLLCVTGHSWTVKPLWYECLIQWQQNGSKAMMWQLYKIAAIWGVPKMCLLDWQLCVSCFYPTTPTYYPTTTRGMCVGLPVAVNIYFCGYLWFLSVSFVWIIWVQYATDNIRSTAAVCFIGQCWYFNPQWTPLQAIIKARGVENLLIIWELSNYSAYIYILVFVEGFRRWRGTFWLLNENLTFKGPAA